jgi:AcrR family transcriptional regulator
MRDKIIAAALKVAATRPLHEVTRGAIAKRAKVAPSLVSYYTGTMEDLQTAIVDEAVKTENVAVIGFAIAARHPGVKNVNGSLREKALAPLLNPSK